MSETIHLSPHPDDDELWRSAGFIGTEDDLEPPDYRGKLRLWRWHRQTGSTALLSVRCVVELVGLQMTIQAVELRLYRGQKPRALLPRRPIQTKAGWVRGHYSLFLTRAARQEFANEVLRLVLLDDPQLAEELCEDINIPGTKQ